MNKNMKNKGFTPLEIERKRKRSRFLTGFTLIELLVVVVVIGVLAGMSFVMIQGVIDAARMARSKSFARGIQRQLALNEVGVWRFDDFHTPTRVHDASGWGNHGTLYVGPRGVNTIPEHAWVPGVFGKALSFDGVDDFVRISNSIDLSRGYTIEAWLYFRSWGSHGKPIPLYNVHVANNGLWVHHSSAGLSPRQGGHHAAVLTGHVNRLNVWTHEVYTWDGSTFRSYQNGELKATWAITAPPASSRDGRIGALSVCSHTHDGLIDELRVYNRALTVFEIQQRYVKGIESLLARGIITEDDFNARIAEIENNLVVK